MIPPFSDLYSNGDDICAVRYNLATATFFDSDLFGRDGQSARPPFMNVGDPPPPDLYLICEAVNVTSFVSFEITPPFLADDAPPSFLTENGVVYLHPVENEGTAKIAFSMAEFTTTSIGDSASQYRGLPVLGFVMQKYQNANAQPDLLAAYASASKYRTERNIEVMSQ